jgi:hypothetical protein
MRILFLLITVGFLFMLNSCMTVYENIEFNENGSGSHEYKVDMGELISAVEGMGGMLEMMGGEDGLEAEGLDSVMNMLDDVSLDTLIRFADLPPEALSEVSRPDLLQKMEMEARLNKNGGEMQIIIRTEFDELSDVPLTFDQFNDLKEESSLPGEMMMGMGQGDFLNMGSMIWNVEKNKIIMEGNPGLFETTKQELGLGGIGEMEDMMKTLTGSVRYEGSIVIPGKIKKNTIPNSTIENGRLKISYTLDDAMINEEAGKGEVIFKMPKAWKKALKN